MSAPFDPAAWLERYTAAGGCYSLADGDIVFFWPAPAEWRPAAVRDIYREVEDQPDRRGAVNALVRERCLIA